MIATSGFATVTSTNTSATWPCACGTTGVCNHYECAPKPEPVYDLRPPPGPRPPFPRRLHPEPIRPPEERARPRGVVRLQERCAWV